MSEMIFHEARFFTASFVWGVLLLLAYDMIRIFRRTLKHGQGAVAAEDLLFWTVGGLLVFVMIYEKNDGIIRGTPLLSLGLGMAAYHYSLSSYVVKWGYILIGAPIKKIWAIFYKGLKKIQKAVKLFLKEKEEKIEKKQGERHGKSEKSGQKSG